MVVATLKLFPHFANVDQWLKSGSSKCENSNENSHINATVQNVVNILRELNPTANVKCEICMYKNKGICETVDKFKTVTEVEKCKWKYDDDSPNTVFFLGLPSVHSSFPVVACYETVQ